MPSKYSRDGSLPLRVPPELRDAVEALVADVARCALPLNRNSVAVAALARGVAELRAELGADPFAVHRALAAASPAAGAPIARGTGGTSAPGVAPGASRGGDEGAPDRPAARSRPRAATPKASAPTRRPRSPATAGALPPSTEGPDAPTPDAVRELLATVLDRDRAVAKGAKGWTVKALAAALGCDRRALQVFRSDGSGMGRPLQLRLWSTLRSDPPARG